MIAGLVSGGLILPPLIIIIERRLAERDRKLEERAVAREAERWRIPALIALQTYTAEHHRHGAQFLRKLDEVLYGPGEAPALEEALSVHHEIGRRLELLAGESPGRFEDLAETLWTAHAELGRTVVGVVPAIALYPPLRHMLEHATDIELFSRARDALRDAATSASSIASEYDQRYSLGLFSPDRARAYAKEVHKSWMKFELVTVTLETELYRLSHEVDEDGHPPDDELEELDGDETDVEG